jgi:hypothetical protein
MPRSQSAKSRAPFTSTSKKANATGYQKRKSKSGLTKKNAISDVYEFEDNTNERRAKVRLELERDEEMGFGRMSDQEEGGGDIAHRVKMFGIGGDDEVIGSEDDDEIDSDAAFEESDEDRFAGFSFASSVRLISHISILEYMRLTFTEDRGRSKRNGQTKNLRNLRLISMKTKMVVWRRKKIMRVRCWRRRGTLPSLSTF